MLVLKSIANYVHYWVGMGHLKITVGLRFNTDGLSKVLSDSFEIPGSPAYRVQSWLYQ